MYSGQKFTQRRHWLSSQNQRKRFNTPFTNTSSQQQVTFVNEPPKCDLKEGEVVEGFTVDEISDIPEFQMRAIRLNHEDTGAQYLHLQREDNNNAFAINLRTTPFDSTGVPHILEHTTLCGSKKYPCRDPFFKMLNRSMATFMNAMTDPDHTMYPFATQHEKDYYNLMSVYMDAVFNPRLRESDFRQEGWRLEHEDVDNPKSPIVFKGVVFNEMKGEQTDNQKVFGEGLLNGILPSHTYGVNFGGDPLRIPNLTYEKLKAFHAKFYHPSNTKFYSYGNFQLRNHLKFINNYYLKHYGKVNKRFSEWTKVPNEKRWPVERKEHMTGRINSMMPDPEKQSSIAIAHLCADIKDVDETFTLNVISDLLTAGPNSEFYKGLVEPNIGAAFTSSTGYDSHTKDTYFSVGLQGVNPKDNDNIIERYNNTIDQVINNGFDRERVDAILHNIELSNKHQSGDYGLRFLYSVNPIWNHDGDVIKFLKVNDTVKRFKEKLDGNPRFLQEKVEQYLQKNSHRLTLTMSPDPEFEEKLAKREKDLLQSKLSALTPEMIKKVFEDGLSLKAEQDKPQNADCLPSLKICDLEKDIKNDEVIQKEFDGVPVQVSLQPTNEVTYVKGMLSTSHLPQDLKPYVPIFASVITKMGTEKHDFREFDKLAQLKTGGLVVSHHVGEDKYDFNNYEQGLLFTSYSLDRNVDSMFSIWEELLNHFTIKDKSRLESIMKSDISALISGLESQGHIYAMSASAAFINPSCLVAEKNAGMSHIKWLSNLLQNNKYEEVMHKLNDIGTNVFNKKFMRLAVNYTPKNEPTVSKNVESFVGALSGPFENGYDMVRENPGLKINIGMQYELPFPVSYASKSIPIVPYIHNDYAPLRILARLLTSKYLLPLVREKAGAYGAGCRITPGVLSFFSYRDPKPDNSFRVFDNCLEWVNKLEFNEQDIEEAKLGTFQLIEQPESPGTKGTREFLYGVSHEEFKTHRLQLMDVTKDDIVRVASTYLDPARDVSVGRGLVGPANSAVHLRPGEKWLNERL